ncbi:MAG TPA: glycoside hydrolase family 28 protein [Acidobacteriaceae bacterium]|nr:glycoside hydrolase family 28 protein [Acidobacteriaceae bacterium]
MSGFNGWSRRKFSVQMLRLGSVAAFASPTFDPAVAAEGKPAKSDTSGAFDVRVFGAVNDGSVVSTQAIQRAVDACAKSGGGVVHFSPGEYLSGTIFLKSGVTLDFSTGSTLKGSGHLSDYPATVPALRSYTDNYVNRSLIYGEKLENVALTGQGIIDGHGHAFHGAYNEAAASLVPAMSRPFIVRLIQCRNVTVKGITLCNSPMWMQHYLACENLLVDGITVLNLPNGERRSFYNNDGIDVDSCQQVRILNCSFRTEDDGLCFKSTTSIPCRDIVASNCLVMSKCNGIKCGTESVGGFQNITISNCSVYETPYAGIALESVDGGALDGINISNIAMREVGCPVFIRLGGRGRPVRKGDPKPNIGSARNIAITNIDASGANSVGCSVTELPGYYVENVSLRNIRIAFAGGGTVQDAQRTVDEKSADYPESTMFGTLPSYGFFARHAKNVLFDHLDLTAVTPDFRPALHCSDVQNVEVVGLKAAGQGEGAALLCLDETKGALMHGCWLPNNDNKVLQVRGKDSSNIRICCNSREIQKSDIEIGREVPSASVRYADQ